MLKIMSEKEKHPMNRCHFCGTNKSVKYVGKILNPCTTANNRFLNIIMCNKCALIHINDLVK